jgi:hypothetical protein
MSILAFSIKITSIILILEQHEKERQIHSVLCFSAFKRHNFPNIPSDCIQVTQGKIDDQ